MLIITVSLDGNTYNFIYQVLGAHCCLHLQGRTLNMEKMGRIYQTTLNIHSSSIKNKVASCSETFLSMYQTRRHHFLEELNLKFY
jgi:hypothetical protein